MKAKKYRKIAREEMGAALRENARVVFAMFCNLHWRERIKLALLLVRGDSRIEKAVTK